MRKIRILPAADQDFLRIYEHYAYEREVPHVADRIDTGIREALKTLLADNPAIGRKLDDDPVTRAYLVIKSHWVFYGYDDEFVYVRRIIAAKELKSWDNV